MAIIKIGKIKTTPEKTIAYVIEDKRKIVRGKNIICKTISTAMYCSVKNTSKEWEAIRNNFGKNKNILMFHVKQNFGIHIDPLIANEIGCKLAKELFDDFQCIVSTHTNSLYTYNHIIFNSVSFKNGKKYYDTLNSYKKMRQISDRLCEEYGLPVLENTKDFKLRKFIDNGKVKFFEPTERKNKIREGQFSNANDYRNTPSYQIINVVKKSNREAIKADIDNLLPIVKSYEELLSRLRDIGYTIKDKKANGNWLVHIALKAPMQEKFTRDYKIGEKYTREHLTATIEEKVKVYNGEYKYDKITIENLNEDFRKNRMRRNKIEKLIIVDIKNLDKAIMTNKRNKYLLDCINANLKTLYFVENNNIKSMNQITTLAKVLDEKKNQAQQQINITRSILKSVEEKLKNNIIDISEKHKFSQIYDKLNASVCKLSSSLVKIHEQIKEIDNCMRTITRISKEEKEKA